MQRLVVLGDPVPERRGIGQACARIALLGVDKPWELDRIVNEKKKKNGTLR